MKTPGRSPRNLRRYQCMFCEQRLDRVAKYGCAGMYVETRLACAEDGWEAKLHQRVTTATTTPEVKSDA